jgi:hypothetical protein
MPCSYPVLLHFPAERIASPIISNALYHILITFIFCLECQRARAFTANDRGKRPPPTGALEHMMHSHISHRR